MPDFSLAEAFFNFPEQQNWLAAAGLSQYAIKYQAGFSNPDIDTATTPETIWPGGGVLAFPSAAAATTIVSSSASDTSAGTGARTVIVEGLLAGYVANSETVTLNGTTPVSLASNYLRINRVSVASAGSGLTNAGTLTVAVGGVTANLVAIGKSISQSAIFSIASDYQKALLVHLFLNTASGAGGALDFELVKIVGGVRTVIQDYGIDLSGTSFIERDLWRKPVVLEPQTDLIINCTSSSSNNVKVNGVWNLLEFY